MEIIRKIGEMAANPGELSQTALVLTLVTGLLNCFFGYKLMRVWFFFFGAVIGGGVGYVLGRSLGESMAAAYGALALGAVLLGILAAFICEAGVFLLCGGAATLVATYLIHPTTSLVFFGCMLIGALVGFLAVKFVRPMVIVATALTGGMGAGRAIGAFLGWSTASMVLGYVLAAAGVALQWATTGKRRKERGDEEDGKGTKDKRHADAGETEDSL